MNLSRRELLALAAGSAPPATPAPGSKRDMIVRSKRPEDQMPLDGFRDLITPAERFFVRRHHYVPAVDPSSWL